MSVVYGWHAAGGPHRIVPDVDLTQHRVDHPSPMRVEALDYELPAELIADRPTARRDASRLMVAPRDGAPPEHRRVRDLPQLLRAGDLLVVNDTKVLAARLHGKRRGTGGRVEGLYVDSLDATRWRVMLRSGGRLVVGDVIEFAAGHAIELTEPLPDGGWVAAKHSDLATDDLLELVGRMPLPPYILKQRGEADLDALDRERYQTVYARAHGAVAAPTAGLHFTDELIAALGEAGVAMARLTLHVGLGTFAPVGQRNARRSPDAHRALRRARPKRSMQSAGRSEATAAASSRWARPASARSNPCPTRCRRPTITAARHDLLIQPGYAFRYTDAMLTNFHLPRSTLIALVAAKVGLDRLKSLYAEAIEHRYRFYSYGDAMLLVDG
jgi:S-adenosylmethionine:tRNA ribosyltransferase-isomerase